MEGKGSQVLPILLHVERACPDLIVCDAGGDIISAFAAKGDDPGFDSLRDLFRMRNLMVYDQGSALADILRETMEGAPMSFRSLKKSR